MGDWHLNPVYNSTTVVVLFAAGLLALVMLLSPELRRMRPVRRYTLIGLRLAIFALVILAMLRPTHVFTEYKRLPATVIVLADRSRSMQVEDEGVSARSRWAALRERLTEVVPELKSLQEDFEIKLYTFDAELENVDFADGRFNLGEAAEGQQSAIGAAIEDILRRESGKRIAAMVLLSDGAQQAFAPRDIAPQTPVRRLSDLGAPLYTVVFGKERSVGQSRDIAMTDLLVSPTVYVKNELAIAGTLRVDGLANVDVPVQVLYETAPGKMDVIATVIAKANAEGQQIPVNAVHIPLVPGEWKLTLRALPPEGISELVTTNNELSTFVTVLDGGLNVLYLEGSARLEQRFLRRALQASPDIQVDFELFDARDRKRWPIDMADQFTPGKYDVYIIGDLDSSVFRREDLQALVAAVDAGAGLIMLGGYHSFWAGGYQTTPLAQILPIEVGQLDLKTRQRFEDPLIEDPGVHLPGPLKMLPDSRFGDSVSFMQLAPRAGNKAEWEKLPPLKGANFFRTLKTAARPLAVTPDNKVLIAAIEPGNGRVLAFGGDSTWQWSMQGFGDLHKRFWRQVVLWLAKVDESSQGSVWVKLDQRRYSPGRRVEFTAGLRTTDPDLQKNAKFTAEVVLPNGQRRPVRVSRQGDRVVGSFIETKDAGDYKVVVTTGTGKAEGRFTVHHQDLELDNPAARPGVMAALAKMTPGGEAIAPERLGELFEELKQKPAELKVETQSKSTPWDKPEFFLVIVALLSTEWFLRKKWGMV